MESPATPETTPDIAAAAEPIADGGVEAWRRGVRLRALGREQAPVQPHLRLLAFVVVVAHLGIGALLWHLREAPRIADERAVIVELFPGVTNEPALPVPPKPARAPSGQRMPLRRAAGSASVPEPMAEPPRPRLFNPDGSVVLPGEPPASAAMTAAFIAPKLPPEIAIMRHQRPLKVRPNHFDGDYREHPGGLTGFIADNLTFKQEFVLPWGTHVQCAEVFMFVAAGGGCGWYTPYPYYVPTEHWKPASVLEER